MWAWGGNDYGQLGDGTNKDSNVPVQVKGLTNIKEVLSLEFETAYALKTDGTVWSWGNNQNGQLGNGTWNNSNIPVQVKNLTNITNIYSTGDRGGYATKADGTVWAWGKNENKQLGIGTLNDSNIPVLVENLTNVKDMSNWSWSLTALKQDGTVWSWGIEDEDNYSEVKWFQLKNLDNIKKIVSILRSGVLSRYALRTDGTVWSWGDDELKVVTGDTYDDSYIDSDEYLNSKAKWFQVKNLTNVVKVYGNGFTTYALKADGTIWAWGYNKNGQLGNGTWSDSSVPVQTVGPNGVGYFNTLYSSGNFNSNITSGNTQFTVYENIANASSQNNQYQWSEGATITFGNQTVTTDSMGMANINIDNVNTPFTISKTGYLPITTTYINYFGSNTIVLEKDEQTDYPVIKHVAIRESMYEKDGTNIYYYNFPKIELISKIKNTGLVVEKKKMLYIDIDWRSGAYKSIKLVQGSKSIDIGKESYEIDFAKEFDINKPIYIVAESTNGKKTTKFLNIQIIQGSDIKFNYQAPKQKVDVLSDKNENSILNGLDLSFSLGDFEVDVEMSEDGSFKGLIGMTLSEDNYKKEVTFQEIKNVVLQSQYEKDYEDAWEKLEKIVEKIEKGKYEEVLGKNVNYFQMIDNNMNKIKPKVKVKGYIEGKVVNGKRVYTEGGIIVSVSGELKYTKQIFTPNGVPYYSSLSLKGTVEGSVLNKKTEDIVELVSAIECGVKVRASVGVGIKDFVHAGGYGIADGSIKFINSRLDPDIQIKISAEVGLEKTTFGLWKDDIVLYKVTYTNSNETKNKWDIKDEHLFQANQQMPSRRILLASTNIVGLQQYNETSVGLNNIQDEGILKTSVFKDSTPQIIDIDNTKKLAVWIDEESTRSEKNSATLMYSVYNGTSWSPEKQVDDDGTSDLSPLLVKSNNDIYLVWQNATEQVSDDIEMGEFAKKIDIFATRFNSTTENFENITNLTDDNKYNAEPKVASKNDGIYVSWIENTEDDIYRITGTNTIKHTTFNGTKGNIETFKNNLNDIISYDIIDNNGTFSVAYVLDMDNDLSTMNERKLYISYNGEKIIENSVLTINNPVFTQDEIYWYEDTEIKYMSLSDMSTIKSVKEEMEFDTDNFKVVSVNGNKAIIYPQLDENDCFNYYGIYYNEVLNEWGYPIKLTDVGSSDSVENASQGSVNMVNDGTIYIIYNKTEITETDPRTLGDTSLCIAKNKHSNDIAIDSEIYFDTNSVELGEEIEFVFDGTNQGTNIIEDIIVKVTDSNNTELGSNIHELTFLSGETKTIVEKITLPENFNGENVSIEIMPKTVTDNNMSNNKRQALIDLPDVCVEEANIVYDGEKYVLVAQITNNSLKDIQNVSIEVNDSTPFGEIIAIGMVTEIKAKESVMVSFDINNYTNSGEDIYYIQAIVENDANLGNNTKSVNLIPYPVELTEISLNKTITTIEKGKTETLTVSYNPTDTTEDKTVIWSSNNTNVATVSNGVITAIGKGTATITAKVGSLTATCNVTVTEQPSVNIPLTKILLNKTATAIEKGKTETLTITYTPTNTTDNKTITWISNNTSVATVSNGIITAIGKGTATITAKVGSLTATCNVTVTEPSIPLTSIALDRTTLTIATGSTQKLNVTYDPTNTTDNKTITWTSNNTSVATVDANGNVTAIPSGRATTATATITAKAGNRTATCVVTVNPMKINGLKATRASHNSIKITWNRVTNATGYRIYRSTDNKTWGNPIKTITSGNTLTFINTNLNTGTKYYYRIVATIGNINSANSNIVNATPTLTKVTAKVSSNGHISNKVTITRVTGATGYEIERATSKNGKYTRIANTTKLTYTDNKGITTGRTYYYKVRSYRTVGKKKVYGAYSNIISAKVAPSRPTLTVRKTNNTSIRTSWRRIAGASGYEVQMKTGTGSYKKIKTITKGTTVTYTQTKLKKGTTYTFRVRAYKTVNGKKVYSSYSTVKSITLK